MAILSRRRIRLAILMSEQFLHLIQNDLNLNITVFEYSAACFSAVFWPPGLIPFASLWHCWRILMKSIDMNMNYSSLTTMYESIFAPKYLFLVEKIVFAILG